MAANNAEDDGMVSGINVTPLVDVALVLLIIFMVTAHVALSRSIPLELQPTHEGKATIQVIFGVELHANGDTVVDGRLVSSEEAVYGLAVEGRARSADLRAVIRADRAVPHGRVIRVLDLLKQAKIEKIAFAVSPTPIAPGPAAP
jgi:biopolymer transport protein ExbD